jgi:cobalt/nickel transport protein
MSKKLEFIVLAILLIFVAQFIYISSTTHAEYGGADDKPASTIDQITGGTYKPIAKPTQFQNPVMKVNVAPLHKIYNSILI